MFRAALASTALVLSLALSIDTAHAQEAKKDTTRWRFETTPYLWASGIHGTVGFSSRNGQDHTANVGISFGDLLKDLDGALMIQIEGRKNRFGFGAEIIYVKISDGGATPSARQLFDEASLEASQNMREIGPRFRMIRNKHVAVDLLGAARWWKLKNTLTLRRDTSATTTIEIRDGISESWIDIVGGVRVLVPVNDKWLFQARADAGGVGSSFTWQGFGAVRYRVSPSFVVGAGYRYMRIDFHGGDDGLIYNVRMSGLILGGTLPFL